MQDISRQLFQTHGLSKFDAFVLAAKLRYADTEAPRHLVSQTQVDSWNNHAWIDRVFRQSAAHEILQASNLSPSAPFDEAFLENLSGHASFRDSVHEASQQIQNALKASRKERSAGFITCQKCKSADVDVDQVQTRSADEPMTLYALCCACGSKWVVSEGSGGLAVLGNKT
jgi:DNA-directed RNA polymerase subunit M/transcription elongation factor TFIIS